MYTAVKLALRNIIRNPGIFIVQGSILFILMFIAFVSISTNDGTVRGMADVRRQLGNEVKLVPNFDKLNNVQAGKAFELPYITEALGEKLLDSQYITASNYHLQVGVTSKIFPADIQTEGIKITSKPENTAQNTYSFNLMGDSRLDLQSDFVNGSFIMVSGRFHSGKSAGQNSGEAVISRLLAERNGFGIGSTFAIYTSDLKIKQELTVIGIFDQVRQDAMGISFAVAANCLYVPLEAARMINNNARPEQPGDMLTYISYFLDKPDHLNAFIAEAKSRGLDMKKFKLDANDSEFMRRTFKIRSLEAQSKVVLVAVIAIGAAFIVLHTLSALKKRRKEIGFMRTMGIGKRAIVLQLTLEMVIAGFVLLMAAGIIGALAVPSISGFLFKEQIWITESFVQSDTGIYMGEYRITPASMLPDVNVIENTNNTGDVIDKIETLTSPGQVILYLLAGFAVILCGVSVLILKTLRFDPMDSLKEESGRV